ncbi:hypothetical protein WKV44_01445 [Spirochaetia bacterium 38H-sp]|uniref:Uncharacterized protein n=1 Tax=Rarispira pelagica TaxID=3141764 RepID=A0ABU9U946_9SPIR
MKKTGFIIIISFLFIVSCTLPLYNEELIKTLASIESAGMEKLGETAFIEIDWNTNSSDRLFFYPVRDESHINYGLAVEKRNDGNVTLNMIGDSAAYVTGFFTGSAYADNLEVLVGPYDDGEADVLIGYIKEDNAEPLVIIARTLDFNDMDSVVDYSNNPVSGNNIYAFGLSYVESNNFIAGCLYESSDNYIEKYTSSSVSLVPSPSPTFGFVDRGTYSIPNPSSAYYEIFYSSPNPVGYISYKDGSEIKLMVTSGDSTTPIVQEKGKISGYVIDATSAGRLVAYNPDEEMFYFYDSSSFAEIGVAVDATLLNYCGEYEIKGTKKLIFSLASIFDTKDGKAANFTLYAYEP